MKIPLYIKACGETCEYDCPFLDRHYSRGNEISDCKLFNEELEQKWVYSSKEGFKRCHKCREMGRYEDNISQGI